MWLTHNVAICAATEQRTHDTGMPNQTQLRTKTQRMKLTTRLLLLGALIALTLNAPGQSWLTNGLVTYFPFSGNAADASGRGNNGILGSGVGYGVDRFGNPNSSLYFTNGGNGEVYTSLQQPANAAFTISCWFNILPQNGQNTYDRFTQLSPSFDGLVR